MKNLGLLLIALLLCGCAPESETALPALATPGPVQQTQIQGAFRGEGEPAEVVELDSEHGFWSYRSDTLGVEAVFYEDDFSDGTAAWCQAEINWREDDPLHIPEGLTPGTPETLAMAAQSVLFMPETERRTLMLDEMPAVGGERLQRAGYGVLPDGSYVAIALSGRYEGESVGLTEEEFAGLFRDAGCVEAVQLASGPSSAMLLMGVILTDPFSKDTATAAGGVGWGRSEF